MMDAADIAGLGLVLAGIAWFFLVEWGGTRRRTRGEAPSSPLETVLQWASQHLSRKFLPGVALIAFGVILLL